MIWKPTKILAYSTVTNTWSKKSFINFKDYYEAVKSSYKMPGEYHIKNSHIWRDKALKYQKSKRYCDYVRTSKDYKDFWLVERRKCEQGIFVDDFFIPGDYYFFLNYCPIFNKLEMSEELPDIWDGHYHYALYLELAWLEDMDGGGTKARQKGISLVHMARIIKRAWFGRKATLKVAGFEEEYVLGEWSIMEGYKNHLNKHTGWYREFNPGELLNWEQKSEVTEGDVEKRKVKKGNMSKIKGVTTKRNFTKAVGGCHLKGQEIYTTSGIKKVEDIVVGDFVFGLDGKPKKVLNLFSGESSIYKVSQKYGVDYFVTDNHRLYLESQSKQFKKKEDTPTILEYLNKPDYYKRSYSGVIIKNPIEFAETSVQIDPYLLGLWLGDGYSWDSSFIVNKTRDPEIFEYLTTTNFNQRITVRRKEESRYVDEMYHIKLTSSNLGTRDNYLGQLLKKNNLIRNKHIPKEYVENTKEVRLQILAGIIDTDGTYNKKRQVYEISSSKKQFLEEVKQITDTLGMYSSIRIVSGKAHNVQEKEIKKTISYILKITIPENIVIPCKIERKKAGIKRKRTIGRTPISVEYFKEGEYFGFECEDHLYCLKGGTVTHNSALEIYATEAGIYQNLRKVKEYVAPNMKQGGVKTGMFVFMGAVGELKDAADLQEFCLNPLPYNIKSVPDTFSGSMEPIAFFFPDEWNYVYKDPISGRVIKCYDENGNSDLTLARQCLAVEEEANKKKDETSYKLWKSQHPSTLQDAFDQREDNPFPTQRLKDREMKCITQKNMIVSLSRDFNKKVIHSFSDDKPIDTLNPKPGESNKGAIEIKELPRHNAPFGLYYAGVDPIANLTTSTSKSLMSVSIWIGLHEVDGKLCEPYCVATYTGRHKNASDTYQICLDLIEFYNARVVAENNVKDFIEWIIRQGKSRLLMQRRELTVISEMSPNSTIANEYGVRTEGEFKKRCLEKLIFYLDQVIGVSFNEQTGEGLEIYGTDKVWDLMFIREMLKFTPKLNTDRLIAQMLALIGVQSAVNRHIISTVKSGYEKPISTMKSLPSPFRGQPVSMSTRMPSPFMKRK